MHQYWGLFFCLCHISLCLAFSLLKLILQRVHFALQLKNSVCCAVIQPRCCAHQVHVAVGAAWLARQAVCVENGLSRLHGWACIPSGFSIMLQLQAKMMLHQQLSKVQLNVMPQWRLVCSSTLYDGTGCATASGKQSYLFIRSET